MTESDYFKTLREIGDLSNEGMMIFSFATRQVIYVNKAASGITGLSVNDSQRSIEALFDYIIPEDREYLKNLYVQVVEKAVVPEVEFRMKKENDQHTHLCCNAYPVLDGAYLAIFLRDITRPKEHETYLVEFGAKKNTLLDTLVHHISGALNLMMHLSAEAQRSINTLGDKNTNAFFSLMNENSKLCLEIIQDLLKEEHNLSPGIFVKNSRINIVQKIGFIVEELRQSYRHRSFGFTTSAPAIYINTDEVKLLQVVNNLTSNSIKFTPENKPIVVNIQEQQQHVIVSVEDHGIGIPDQLKPFVFDRKGGAGRTGLNGERSIGMGLSICRNLIQLLMGEMWFESAEGAGSKFYFSLPKE